MTIASRIVCHVGTAIIALFALPMAIAQNIGCTPAQRANAKGAFVDCVKADPASVLALLAKWGIESARSGHVAWDMIEADAWEHGKVIGGCAVDRFVDSIEPHPAAGVLPLEGPGSAMRERLRAHWGGVEWRGAEVR